MPKTADTPPFSWWVARDGYAWRNGIFSKLAEDRKFNGPALVALGGEGQLSQPPPGLFLEFSRLQSDTDIVNFASQFGLLGVGPPLGLIPERAAIEEIDAEDDASYEPFTGELLSQWQNEIFKMHAAIELWQAVQEEDKPRLKQHIHWAKDHSLIEFVGYERKIGTRTLREAPATIAAAAVRPELLPRFKPGDLIGPARLVLQERINAKLEELVSCQLLWAQDKIQTADVAKTLLGFLWFQLATAWRDFDSFRKCAVCAKLMVLTVEGSAGFRTHRRTCSIACRVKMYEDRKRRAREMLKQGITAKEIASKLETDVTQVRKWVQNVKPGSAPFGEPNRAVG